MVVVVVVVAAVVIRVMFACLINYSNRNRGQL